MYSSPVEIIISQMIEKAVNDGQEQLNAHIIEQICKVGVIVDKEELIRALNYDRRQYAKGYQDGNLGAMTELLHCADCKHFDRTTAGETYCRYWDVDDYEEAFVEANDFCSRGERISE